MSRWTIVFLAICICLLYFLAGEQSPSSHPFSTTSSNWSSMRIPHSPHFKEAIWPVRRSNQPDTNLCVLIANYCICIYRLNNQDCICIFVYLQICRRANMRNSFSQQLGLGNIQIPIMTQIFVASTCDQLVKFATKVRTYIKSILKKLTWGKKHENNRTNVSKAKNAESIYKFHIICKGNKLTKYKISYANSSTRSR